MRQPRPDRRVAARIAWHRSELLEVTWALPADVQDDGTALVRWNVPGSFQLYLVAPGREPVQLTDLGEPASGRFVPGSDRILLAFDEGGNERAQLYLLDATPGAVPEPLVVEPEYMHETPRLDTDGRRLAYACNRRNGRDLDVYLRDLETGREQCVFELGGYCEVAGFSPDGRWLGVLQLTGNTGTTTSIWSTSSRHRRARRARRARRVFGAPVWASDSASFLFPTSSGRDTAAIARYVTATREWSYVIEDGWDLDCLGDRAGRVVAVHANVDGSSRLELCDHDTSRSSVAGSTSRIGGCSTASSCLPPAHPRVRVLIARVALERVAPRHDDGRSNR